MTLGRRVLSPKRKLNSPRKSPKLFNSSLRRKTFLKTLNSSIQIGAPSKANLKVVVRVRPENQKEINSNGYSVVEILDDFALVFDPVHEDEGFFFQGKKHKFRDLNKKQCKEQKFMFEKIFDPLVANEEVFENTSKDIVETLINGYNCSVFAYGATGSGKTFTMIGSESCPGITFLTVMELYKKIAEVEATKVCEIGVSYLEIYNEMVRDLLAPGKPLNLQENGQSVKVSGLSFHKPSDANELLTILAEGNRNRSQHPTDANAESSRSHAVFQVFLKQRDHSSEGKSNVCVSKLSMIDLAGSERGMVTGFKGTRFREGANINRSLLALGNCINALADGKSHIPYRDSKLTRLLKDSLGGNCRSVMVATITQSSLSYEDTFNTLRYANRAKTIKMTLKKNVINVNQHVSQYIKLIEDMKTQISTLQQELKEYKEKENENNHPIEMSHHLSSEEKDSYENTIAGLKAQIQMNQTNDEHEASAKTTALEELTVLHNGLKSDHREYLQLETAEKELHLKIYTQRLCLYRMQVFSFASSKLDKGISRCNRSVDAYQRNLEHIQKRKEEILVKMEQKKLNISDFCDSCTVRFPSDGRFPSEGKMQQHAPEFVTNKLKESELEKDFLNSLLIKGYFESLVKELVKDQVKNEKILLFLLYAVKQLYLRLKMINASDKDVADLMEKLYSMLDESRIEWADFKNTENSFCEKIISEHVPHEPAIDVRHLLDFPTCASNALTPVVDFGKMFKKSNLKKCVDTTKVDENGMYITCTETSDRSPLKAVSPKPSVLFPNVEGIESIQNVSKSLSTNFTVEESPDFKILGRFDDPNDSKFLEIPSLRPSVRDSLLIRPRFDHSKLSTSLYSDGLAQNVGQSTSSLPSILESPAHNFNSTVTLKSNLNSPNHENMKHISDTSPSPCNHDVPYSDIDQANHITHIPIPKSPVQNLDCTVTLNSNLVPPDLEKSKHTSDASPCLQTRGTMYCDIDQENPNVALSDIPLSKSPLPNLNCTVSLESNPAVNDLNTNQVEKLSTFNLPTEVIHQKDGIHVLHSPQPNSRHFTRSPCNERKVENFSGNDTFCISGQEIQDVASLVPLPSLPRGKENTLHVPSNFKKPARTMLSSKFSSSKLLCSASKKFSSQGLKRTVSGSSLPSVSGKYSAHKDSSLKKSMSFLRNPLGSSNKNNAEAPKSVGFGSTFLPQRSVKQLNFRSPQSSK